MGFAPHNLLFFGISCLIILLASLKIAGFNEKPITISQIKDILDHPKEKLFYISHALYTPTRILLYRPIIKNGSRSNKFSVEHIFVTPISSPTKKEPVQLLNFWITQKYIQHIPKAIPLNSKESMIREFSIQSRAKLISQLQHKPKFYKILYNELNLAKNRTTAYELIKSSQIFNTKTIILEPHWETFVAYKKQLLFQLFWMFTGVVSLNIITAIVIAIKR